MKLPAPTQKMETRVLDVPLNIRDDLPGVGLVPEPV
jgi:hypothetical protein